MHNYTYHVAMNIYLYISLSLHIYIHVHIYLFKHYVLSFGHPEHVLRKHILCFERPRISSMARTRCLRADNKLQDSRSRRQLKYGMCVQSKVHIVETMLNAFDGKKEDARAISFFIIHA